MKFSELIENIKITIPVIVTLLAALGFVSYDNYEKTQELNVVVGQDLSSYATKGDIVSLKDHINQQIKKSYDKHDNKHHR